MGDMDLENYPKRVQKTKFWREVFRKVICVICNTDNNISFFKLISKTLNMNNRK